MFGAFSSDYLALFGVRVDNLSVFHLGASRVRDVVKRIWSLVVRVPSKVLIVTVVVLVYLLTVVVVPGEGTEVRPDVIVVKVLTILDYLKLLFNPVYELRVE